MMTQQYDILIVGGGISGLTFALLLAKHTRLSIAILEAHSSQPAFDDKNYHHRVSAISLFSQRLFASLDVWKAMKALRVAPFEGMNVWDDEKKGEIFFDCGEAGEPCLGFIVENPVMHQVLLERVKNEAQIAFYSPVLPKKIINDDENIAVETEDHTFRAKLLVAADGGNSWVRQQAMIDVDRHDYQEKAIVGTVKTEFSHSKIARQAFLDTGPLAFLPLAESHFSSIVWSLPEAIADEKMLLSEEEFAIDLQNKMENKFGRIEKIQGLHAFPLKKLRAKQYIKPRIALLADAAHTVHPLAGQGLNMGLQDVSSLSSYLIQAIQKRQDFSHFQVLRRYERERKAENFSLFFAIDELRNLFSSKKRSVQILRSLGLDMINQSSWIKKNIISFAAN